MTMAFLLIILITFVTAVHDKCLVALPLDLGQKEGFFRPNVHLLNTQKDRVVHYALRLKEFCVPRNSFSNQMSIFRRNWDAEKIFGH